MAIDPREFIKRLFGARKPRKDAEFHPLNFPEMDGSPTSQLLGGAWVDIKIHDKSASMAYDDDRKQMFVKYPGGKIYVYEGVSQYEATGLYAASSRGSWIWDNLRVRGTIDGAQKPFALISDPGSIKIKKHSNAIVEHQEFPNWEGT